MWQKTLRYVILWCRLYTERNNKVLTGMAKLKLYTPPQYSFILALNIRFFLWNHEIVLRTVYMNFEAYKKNLVHRDIKKYGKNYQRYRPKKLNDSHYSNTMATKKNCFNRLIVYRWQWLSKSIIRCHTWIVPIGINMIYLYR